MKKFLIFLLIVFVVPIGVFFVGCNKAEQGAESTKIEVQHEVLVYENCLVVFGLPFDYPVKSVYADMVEIKNGVATIYSSSEDFRGTKKIIIDISNISIIFYD